MNENQREGVANVLRNFTNEQPRDLDVALDAIEQELDIYDDFATLNSDFMHRIDWFGILTLGAVVACVVVDIYF